MPKALLGSNGLNRRSQNINASWWYYEEPRGLLVVRRPMTISTNTVLIPWRSIRASLKRHDASILRKSKSKKSPERSHHV